MSNKTIILAHGVLGFGELKVGPGNIHYFNGVSAHLEKKGITVFSPQVNPVGSIKQRGDMLAEFILHHVPPGTKAHIIAHSMGGLDSRHAITNAKGVSERIATLVTIGTPHQGSPVADAIEKGSGAILRHIPDWLSASLRNNVQALHNLTVDFCTNFDKSTPDIKDVRYLEVAGDASLGGNELFLFELAAAIGNIHNEVNDGVVTKSSALREGHQHLPDWPVDHAGEIGWTKNLMDDVGLSIFHTPPHLARYDKIVEML